MGSKQEMSNFFSEGEINKVIDLASVKIGNYSECSLDMMDPIAFVTPTGTLEQEFIENTVFMDHTRSHLICSSSLSPNLELAITGTTDGLMYIWDTNTGNNINIIRCGYNCRSVTFAEFNHDGTYIATASYGEEGFIRVWEVSSKTNFDSTLIDELALVKWHHSANILLAMNNDGDTYIFNFLSKEEVTKELINANEIISPKCGLICPDGKFVVGCKFGPKNKNYYRENEMLYASTFRLIRSLNLNYNYEEDIRLPISEGYKDDIISIDCDVNNKLLISASKDGKTRLSAPHNGELIAVLQNLNFGKHDYCIEDEQKSKKHNDCTKDEQESKSNKDWPNTVAFCRDPTLPLAASGTYNGKLFIWDVSKQILKYTIHIYPGRPITKILWKTNSTILFLSTSDGIIGCVDAKTGKYLWLCKGQIWIEDLYMSKNEKKLLAFGGSTAIVFDISYLDKTSHP